MTTKSKTGSAPEAVAGEAINNYLELLSTSQEKFAKSLKGATERAARVNGTLIEALIESQRAALETGKRIAANPTDYASNVKAVMESATAAQERVLGLAKTLYQEQADIAAEFRTLFQGSFDASDLSEAARKFAAFWPKAA
jgi:hypothetical protein